MTCFGILHAQYLSGQWKNWTDHLSGIYMHIAHNGGGTSREGMDQGQRMMLLHPNSEFRSPKVLLNLVRWLYIGTDLKDLDTITVQPDWSGYWLDNLNLNSNGEVLQRIRTLRTIGVRILWVQRRPSWKLGWGQRGVGLCVCRGFWYRPPTRETNGAEDGMGDVGLQTGASDSSQEGSLKREGELGNVYVSKGWRRKHI